MLLFFSMCFVGLSADGWTKKAMTYCFTQRRTFQSNYTQKSQNRLARMCLMSSVSLFKGTACHQKDISKHVEETIASKVPPECTNSLHTAEPKLTAWSAFVSCFNHSWSAWDRPDRQLVLCVIYMVFLWLLDVFLVSHSTVDISRHKG